MGSCLLYQDKYIFKSETELIKFLNKDPTHQKIPFAEGVTRKNFALDISDKGMLTDRITTTRQSADKKALIKAKIATKYCGTGKDIEGSSTQDYLNQSNPDGKTPMGNTGIYSGNDIVFASFPGRRGKTDLMELRIQESITEAQLALNSGAIVLTDNLAYTATKDYNIGEKRAREAFKKMGAIYTEVEVGGELIGAWKLDYDASQKQSNPVTTLEVHFTKGHNKQLSNLSYRPFIFEGFRYVSVEHAYQTLKSVGAILPDGSIETKSEEVNAKYLAAHNSTTATVEQIFRSKKTTNVNNNANLALMRKLMQSSFEQSSEALKALLDTGSAQFSHTVDDAIWKKEFPAILLAVRSDLRSRVSLEQFEAIKKREEENGNSQDICAPFEDGGKLPSFEDGGIFGNILNIEKTKRK